MSGEDQNMGKPQGINKWCLTLPRSLSPLHMEAPRRKQATLRGRMRLMCGSPSMSILSEAFSVSKYQKYMEGVIRAHSGSGGTWLWTCLLYRVTLPPPSISLSPSHFPFSYPSSIPSLPTSLRFSAVLSQYPPHRIHWSSSLRDTAPRGEDTGRTGSSRRASRH